ncbi:MAG: hypothetical protein ACLQDY_23680 [Streptosporangiaceae bacterium]
MPVLEPGLAGRVWPEQGGEGADEAGTVSIVSSNSGRAIRAYPDRQDLADDWRCAASSSITLTG